MTKIALEGCHLIDGRGGQPLSDATVVIEGDENVSYTLMVNVLDALRKSGFKGVNLKTKEPE